MEGRRCEITIMSYPEGADLKENDAIAYDTSLILGNRWSETTSMQSEASRGTAYNKDADEKYGMDEGEASADVRDDLKQDTTNNSTDSDDELLKFGFGNFEIENR